MAASLPTVAHGSAGLANSETTGRCSRNWTVVNSPTPALSANDARRGRDYQGSLGSVWQVARTCVRVLGWRASAHLIDDKRGVYNPWQHCP